MTFKRVLLVVAMVVPLVFLVQRCNQEQDSIPTDNQIRDAFDSYYSKYEKLKSIILTNGIYRVSISNSELSSLPQGIASQELANELFEIMHDGLKVDLINTRFRAGTYEEIEEIMFYKYRDGLSIGGQGKGISYLLSKPSAGKIMENLDGHMKNGLNNGSLISGQRIYKKLTERWYIFYEYFD